MKFLEGLLMFSPYPYKKSAPIIIVLECTFQIGMQITKKIHYLYNM